MYFIEQGTDDGMFLVSKDHMSIYCTEVSRSELIEFNGLIPVTGVTDTCIFAIQEMDFSFICFSDSYVVNILGDTSMVRTEAGKYRLERLFYMGALRVIEGILCNLVLPDKVTAIGSQCFQTAELQSLESVVADGVHVISESAFSYAVSLRTVSFKNLKEVSDRAFYGCAALEEFIAEDSLGYIGTEAFRDCRLLRKADLKNVSIIGTRAFAMCVSLEEVRLERKGVHIYSDAFLCCPKLKRMYVRKGIDLGISGIDPDKVEIIVV